jgi:cation transport ATPase
MKATRVGEDSSIQRMIRLVQSADAGKAKIVGLADRWATWIVVIALTATLLTWLISGKIIRAVTILVVFCPCALVLVTPTAITSRQYFEGGAFGSGQISCEGMYSYIHCSNR